VQLNKEADGTISHSPLMLTEQYIILRTASNRVLSAIKQRSI